ncbi:class I SAM-dependent methyltransferase [Salipiger sp.]|uniref:class I SAM-dependent methyltransferase n=1 Tax=Salipiger sp. TaxID=2078585 RepID=UPI003A972FF3
MSLFARKPKIKPGYHIDPEFQPHNGTHYIEVMDRLEAHLKPRLYLEIGSRSGTSVARRSCSFIAVDPEFRITADVFNTSEHMLFFQQTSDDFFASRFLQNAGLVPDLAFIDGMHLFEFALRDFINCEASMRPDGVICLHDVAPFNHDMITRDLAYLGRSLPWTGDVWKVMAVLKEYRPDLAVELLNAASTGLGVVSGLDPESRVLGDRMDEILERFGDRSLADFGVERYFDLFPLKRPEDLNLWTFP